MPMEQWLNASGYGMALGVLAWAATRSPLLNAAWRCRIWGAALVALAVLLMWPAISWAATWDAGPGLPGGMMPPASLARPGDQALLVIPAVAVPAWLALGAWAAVALWRATVLALAVARVRSARAAARPFPENRRARLPEWTAANAGRCVLVLSDRLPSAAMLGFGRPMIAVPSAWLDRLSDEALDAVLLHELAHAQRRDDLADLAQRLLLAACWFHPAAWWISAGIAFEREAACDESAARLTTTRRYARCLVTIAELMQAPGRQPATLVAASLGRRRQLVRRVDRLLAGETRRPLARSSCVAAPALAAVTALALTAPALPRLFEVASGAPARLASRAAPADDLRPMDVGETQERSAEGASAAAKAGRGARQAEPLQPRAEAVDRRESNASAGSDESLGTPDGAPAPRDERAIDVRATDEAASDGHLASRKWGGHLVPAVAGSGGALQDNVGSAAGAAAPFRTLGAAVGRAGVGTGRWFARAGASVATSSAFR